MVIAQVFYLIVSLLYAFFIFLLIKGLNSNRHTFNNDKLKKVSVIVAARNEEQNISYCLGSLLRQSYPRSFMEIIVVDDHSTDRTLALANECADKFSNIRVLSSPPLLADSSPKKVALATGISVAQGEILLFTDADCAVPPQWVERVIKCFDENTGAVASWVLPPEEDALRSQIELLDSLSLQLIGAGAIGHGKPFLANGANLAYRRELYINLNGFKDIQELGSGDDDLFLQKIYQKSQMRTLFLSDPRAIVTTLPNSSWRDFFRQRIRWSSKASAYPWSIRLLEGFIFSYYSLLLFGLPLSLIFSIPWWPPLLAFFAKFVFDWFLIKKGSKLVQRTFKFPVFLFAELMHLCYIPPVGILGFIGMFTWKGRIFKKGRLSCR